MLQAEKKAAEDAKKAEEESRAVRVAHQEKEALEAQMEELESGGKGSYMKHDAEVPEPPRPLCLLASGSGGAHWLCSMAVVPQVAIPEGVQRQPRQTICEELPHLQGIATHASHADADDARDVSRPLAG